MPPEGPKLRFPPHANMVFCWLFPDGTEGPWISFPGDGLYEPPPAGRVTGGVRWRPALVANHAKGLIPRANFTALPKERGKPERKPKRRTRASADKLVDQVGTCLAGLSGHDVRSGHAPVAQSPDGDWAPTTIRNALIQLERDGRAVEIAEPHNHGVRKRYRAAP